MDLFDQSLNESGLSIQNKKSYREGSFSSPGKSDLIQLKGPGALQVDRSCSKFRDLFNSKELIESQQIIPFSEEDDDSVDKNEVDLLQNSYSINLQHSNNFEQDSESDFDEMESTNKGGN